MSASIIPLRPRGDHFALAELDQIAAELLADGQAANLSVARINLLLTKIRAQRAELAAVVEDLQARPHTSDTQVDQVNADLNTVATSGLAHIDQLIQLIEAWRPSTTKSDPQS
jgi:hypothetical protein